MAAGIESILKLEVPVIVQIAQRTMAVDDVMSMAPGAIIELPKSADRDLEILVNNKAIGTGTAVKVGENYGVRVCYIGDLAERITALGDSGDEVSDQTVEALEALDEAASRDVDGDVGYAPGDSEIT